MEDSSLDLLKSQGNEYFKMGSYESALETYFKCLESIEMDSKDEKDDQNDDAEIRTTLNVNIAAVYMKIKDWAKCVEYASKTLVSDPEDKMNLKWKAMYRRGVALKHLKRYPQAAAELTIVLKLKPDYAKAKKHLESIRKLMKPPAPPLTTIKGLKERKVGINEFEIQEDLGEGNFSNVVKATHKITKESFALKSIEIKKVKRLRIRHPNIDNEIMMEKSVLSKLKHPGVIEMYHTFKDALNLYFLLEYVF